MTFTSLHKVTHQLYLKKKLYPSIIALITYRLDYCSEFISCIEASTTKIQSYINMVQRIYRLIDMHISSVQLLSHVRLFATPWTTARQASRSITNSQSLLKLMTIEMVMPSNHLILSSSSPPTFSLSQYPGLFKRVSSSHQMAKVLEFQFQHQSFQ